ncbi:Lrp/AsnC family transcriptional regulator [Pleomorphomonas diazotrophica]|uniref:Lrp/AsnC family transcriptional regulator n=1 Tax=Pleomorphomonas diazotrophica TaxID=1166257 RepID=A0A1I4R4K8_9HYPH|nr:Lrp/AsnC family transcriptional regulator [Pleomorphomonas diazotrophica]PKR90202.1 Lrp/AsnC family transcriptional regulator [Pleomorphomonas diazotrophica]SFM47248.1 Lrp/AsnC family transcriptional regulator, leucine-responsive regulatory protein [Pleomorphomonas diazotrophica]
MDEIDRQIVICLGDDARRSLADIGREVGLSTSAVNERIRRLQAGGVIRRFTVDADAEAMGLGVSAFVFIGLAADADEAAFRLVAAEHPAIVECQHVTGGWNYLVKIRVASLSGIEAFLDDLKRRRLIARSETMIALSTVVEPPFRPRGDRS